MNIMRGVCAAVVVATGVAANALAADSWRIELPLERTAYFIGETIPLALAGPAGAGTVNVEAVNADGRTLLHEGRAAALWLDTSRLAPGDYQLAVNGETVVSRLSLTSPLRRSFASLQDEATPRAPQFDKAVPAAERPVKTEEHWNVMLQTFRESGLTACLALGGDDFGHANYLDFMVRAGAMLLVNPDTRPTSFFPVGNNPAEQDSMSRRMILSAQANGRYPSFGGFCFGWDTTGYAIGNRRGLLTYWGWGKQTQALRNYLERIDNFSKSEFTRRTGLAPVTEGEYIAYMLSIKRPEFAPAIDLPTRLWLDDIARHTPPMADAERVAFEARLDAWSAYLMGQYREAYGAFIANLRKYDPTLRHTSSVQIDHAPVRQGQYTPAAYETLDFQYQTTWNDQVGGPDYSYQCLLTAGILDMHRGDKPTWLSNAIAAAHGRAGYPGKFVRGAAHGLALGATGIGFALEGFSNLLGGMNQQTHWANIRGKSGGEDVRTGKDFMDRFAALAVEGRGDHGVGILFSRSQFQRQHAMVGFGTPHYKLLMVLTRLGYTPRLVTEEDLVAGRTDGLRALVVAGQTFALPEPVMQAVGTAVAGGMRIVTDGGTTVALPGAEVLDWTSPSAVPGKPHSWSAPNMIVGDNDTFMAARWYAEMAPVFAKALGDAGRGLVKSASLPANNVTLMQIAGGADARYIVAVNDSHVRTQADWHQVKERLEPVAAGATGQLYDLTEERDLGPLAAFDCDLTKTTARVFGVLARPVDRIGLTARQKLAAGESLAVAVRFLDAAGKALAAVIPFEVELRRPDGAVQQAFYRATDRSGAFAMAVPVPVNAPGGQWTVVVRSQLDGKTATLPVTVAAGSKRALAGVLNEALVVRDPVGLDAALAAHKQWVLPVFDTPARETLQAAAEKVREVLAAQGVKVEILNAPVMGTYLLGYDPTAEELAENARIEAGELIGKVRRTTVNRNDWYSGMMDYHFGKPLLLLDLQGFQVGTNKPAVVNPLADDLTTKGLLWPRVTAAYPGAGRAVLQTVDWAFAPRMPTVVIQATDAAGLQAAVAGLTKRPADRLTDGVRGARNTLWQESRIGGRTAMPAVKGLTAEGLTAGMAPQPFEIRFPGERPPAAEAVTPPPPAGKSRVHKALPAVFESKEGVLHYRDDHGQYIETSTVGFLFPDLRFSEAIALPVEAAQAGKVRIVYDGLFRYSDRQPMWQAQWEDIIALREKRLPKERLPMVVDVRLGDVTLGTLVPSVKAEREVQLELAASSAGLKPRTEVEEVVVRLEGEIALPAGQSEILLIHRHMVDGKLTAIGVGMEPPVAEAAAK